MWKPRRRVGPVTDLSVLLTGWSAMSDLRNSKGRTRTAPARPPEHSDSDSLPDDEGEGNKGNEPESTGDGALKGSSPWI